MKSVPGICILPVLFVLGGCGGGGSANVDCDEICAKEIECNSAVDPAACADQCGTYNRVMSKSLGDAVSLCYEKSCDQIEACINTALQNCDTNLDGFLNALCQRYITCQAGVTLEQCKAQMLLDPNIPYFKCFSTSSLNTMGNCAQAASCATFDSDFRSCVEDSLGIDLSSDD